MAICDRSRAPVLGAGILGAACMLGCIGKDEGADGQYRRVLDALEEGSLSKAYEAFIPPSYDRDLNDLISRMQGLIGKEELAVLRDLVTRSVNGLAVVLSSLPSKEPAIQALASKVKELPATLGLDNLEEFQRLDARRILAALEKTFFRSLVTVEGVRSKLASVKVEVIESRGDWAKVRFSFRDGDTARDDVQEMVRQDGKWVPPAWVAEWPRQMANLRTQIDALAQAKTKNPRVILESLEVASAALDPGKLSEMLLGAMGGGSPSRP